MLALLQAIEQSKRYQEDKDADLALACALVDELELSWESEWQQTAIIDWELEYSDGTQLKNSELLG